MPIVFHPKESHSLCITAESIIPIGSQSMMAIQLLRTQGVVISFSLARGFLAADLRVWTKGKKSWHGEMHEDSAPPAISFFAVRAKERFFFDGQESFEIYKNLVAGDTDAVFEAFENHMTSAIAAGVKLDYIQSALHVDVMESGDVWLKFRVQKGEVPIGTFNFRMPPDEARRLLGKGLR